jgi:diadenosine tetraphosphate (Ap4A) HIT family hydrolase
VPRAPSTPAPAHWFPADRDPALRCPAVAGECLTCAAGEGRVQLSLVPSLAVTEHWRIEQGHPTRVRGWLVVVLRRHAPALHDLTGEEWAELATVLAAVCQASREVVGAEKEYVMQFAEAEGHQHVHFHVVPRLPEWPHELSGPRAMEALGTSAGDPLTLDEVGPTLEALRLQLQQRLGG